MHRSHAIPSYLGLTAALSLTASAAVLAGSARRNTDFNYTDLALQSIDDDAGKDAGGETTEVKTDGDGTGVASALGGGNDTGQAQQA